MQAHPFLPTLKVFQAPLQKGREETILVIAVNKVSIKYCFQIVLKYHGRFPWINTLMINIPCLTVDHFGILNILSKINETIVNHTSKMEHHFLPFISVYLKSFSTEHILIRLLEDWRKKICNSRCCRCYYNKRI